MCGYRKKRSLSLIPFSLVPVKGNTNLEETPPADGTGSQQNTKQFTMKLLFALLALWLATTNPTYLVVDRNLKKPVAYSASFTTAQYLQQTFPVYKADVEAVVDAVDQALKVVEKPVTAQMQDTITAAHTTFLIRKYVGIPTAVDVVLLTTVSEIHTSFSFSLVRQETDLRSVQRRLLDFATYLNP